MLVCIAKTCDFLLYTCQKVDFNLIVFNNALIRNVICVFLQKNIILLHIVSVQLSDDLFHNFCDSFWTK